MHHTFSGGFIGLISLLIVSLLMALFYWRTDLFAGSAQKNSPSIIEQDMNAIQAAKDARTLMETRSAAETELLAN